MDYILIPVKDKTETDFFMDLFKKMKKNATKLSADELEDLIKQAKAHQKQDKTWWLTKFIGVNYCYTIMKNGKEDDVIKWLYQYGSSQTKNSSIFIKYSA